MYFPTFKKNNAFKEQVEKTWASTFDALTSQVIIRVMKTDNTRVLVLLILYEKRMSIVFNVLVVVIYFIL